MDVVVTLADQGSVWNLTDLLGRSMGCIVQISEQFHIRPAGQALATMAPLEQGPYLSLDAALAMIEKRIHGVCRRDPRKDQ